MYWEDLRIEAQKILENEPAGEYEDRSFRTNSGSLKNNVGVPEVYRNAEFKYNTHRNGAAYAHEVVVRCRKTRARDKNNRAIYEAKGGKLFVYKYLKGNAYHFDHGRLIEPSLGEGKCTK